MALFMDVHSIAGGVTETDVAGAHAADLATQGEHDVNYLKYWVDEEAGKIFCLVEAPDADAANTVHRDAHGLVADEIFKVSEHPLVRDVKSERGSPTTTRPSTCRTDRRVVTPPADSTGTERATRLTSRAGLLLLTGAVTLIAVGGGVAYRVHESAAPAPASATVVAGSDAAELAHGNATRVVTGAGLPIRGSGVPSTPRTAADSVGIVHGTAGSLASTGGFPVDPTAGSDLALPAHGSDQNVVTAAGSDLALLAHGSGQNVVTAAGPVRR